MIPAILRGWTSECVLPMSAVWSNMGQISSSLTNISNEIIEKFNPIVNSDFFHILYVWHRVRSQHSTQRVLILSPRRSIGTHQELIESERYQSWKFLGWKKEKVKSILEVHRQMRTMFLSLWFRKVSQTHYSTWIFSKTSDPWYVLISGRLWTFCLSVYFASAVSELECRSCYGNIDRFRRFRMGKIWKYE